MGEHELKPHKGRRERVISSLYEYTSNVAESSEYGSNLGLTAGAAATLLGMGLDKVEARRNKNGELEYSEADVEAITAMALSAEEEEQRKKGEQSHFVDHFMERLIKHTIPMDSPDAEVLQQRMRDPSRKEKPALSIRILASNIKRMSARMGLIFKAQYGVIHVVTWRKPTKTLSVLVLYTAVCLWPHLVLAFPLLYVLFGMIVPAYLWRHPMDLPELIPVKKRGQTLLEFLNQSDDSSLLTDILQERNVVSDETGLVQSVDTSSETMSEQRSVTQEDKYVDVADRLPKEKNRKFVKSQVSLLMNMRDLQNLTTDLINGLDQAEQVSTDVLGFKDERLTTFIFYILIVLTWVVVFLGRFIPWRLIFIQSGWAFFALCHPNTKKYLVGLQKNRKQVEAKVELANPDVAEKRKKGNIFENFDRQDIIVDDLPHVRVVEIFELQTRNVLKHDWKFYGYSKRFFGYKDPVRVAGKLPHGVDSLGKVLPPKEWKYDFGYANNWRIDVDPEEYIKLRDLDTQHLRIPAADSDEGWVYDSLPVDDDTTTEFRRRRLYRECYRYARPVKPVTFE